MDVLWFRLARRTEGRRERSRRFTAGRLFVKSQPRHTTGRRLRIAKGPTEEIRRAGLDAFRAEVAALADRRPRDRVSEIRSWTT